MAVIGSTFTGVGGLDLGLERAGHTVAFQVESDAYRRDVLERHWPGVPRYNDVCTFDGHPWRGRIDVLAGGFPCQDLSIAGQRAGLAGAKSGLFFEFARIANDALGPGGFVLLENVGGLLSSNRGRDFAVVLATLAELGFHDVAWRVLDSQYFGVPQRRRRVFILGRRGSGRRCATLLLEPEGGGGDFASLRQKKPRATWRLGNGVARSRNTSGRRHDGTVEDFVVVGTGAASADVAGTLGSLSGSGSGGGQRSTEIGGNGAWVIHGSAPDANGVRAATGLPGRLDGTSVTTAINMRGREGGAMPELSDLASVRAASGGSTRSYLLTDGQGDASPEDPRPDGRRYAAVGDAVTVNVATWIGWRLNMEAE